MTRWIPLPVRRAHAAWRAVLGLLIVVALAGVACSAREQSAGHHARRFENAERWARVFDDPARDTWQKPDEVVAALALAPAARVADIGSGTGYFAVRLARAVPGGHVWGVDIEPDMVRYLGERARREGLANLTSHHGQPDDPKLPQVVDLVLVVNTYHHIPSRAGYFARLRRSLVPGGRIAIIDFTEEAPTGPPRQFRIPTEFVIEEMRQAGYQVAVRHAFLPHQYFLVFTPDRR